MHPGPLCSEIMVLALHLLSLALKLPLFRKDTMQCIQKYLRRIYRQVKFFSNTKQEFKQPYFVSEEGKKKQTVVLCNWILDYYIYSWHSFWGVGRGFQIWLQRWKVCIRSFKIYFAWSHSMDRPWRVPEPALFAKLAKLAGRGQHGPFMS